MNDLLKTSIQKELNAIAKKEAKLHKKANRPAPAYQEKLESKIPKGLAETLQGAFFKAFSLIFRHGIGIIEKTYQKESILSDYQSQNDAIEKNGNCNEIQKLKQTAQKSDLLNLSVSAAEGIGLGILGLGLPDLVLFIGIILKGIYEIALRYGYDYTSAPEKYLILLMMETALSHGEDWEKNNREVDRLMLASFLVSEETLNKKTEEASDAFATDMLILKFIQGIPVVGVVGGIFNPIYYHKIMYYVKLKYHKRYLLTKLKKKR